MKENIQWTTEYLKLPLKDIQIVEKNIGLAFPQEYINFIHYYQGGKPSPYYIDIQGYGTTAFDCFLTFVIGDDNDILEQYYIVRKVLGTTLLFPIAWDNDLNYFCFDYRKEDQQPGVVYWDRKRKKNGESIYPLCTSFAGLLDQFHR